MTYATEYYLSKLKKAARQPVGWLTAFEQSHYFFSKKIDKKHQTFWLLDKELNRDCQNGASFLPRDLFPTLTVAPYV